MKPIVIATNCRNEIDQCESWFENMYPLTDIGMVIVDTFSEDGTKEFFEAKMKIYPNIVFFQSNIIQTEGYGPARNFLRALAKEKFPEAHWEAHFDFDERIDPAERHQLRVIKDSLSDDYDVVAFPRLNCMDAHCTETKYDYHDNPDWQARMTRLDSPLEYVRKIHEQIRGHKQIYTNLNSPKIKHFHRSTDQKKRDAIGKLCAKLHSEDKEWGKTVPLHPKEKMYFDLYQKEGL